LASSPRPASIVSRSFGSRTAIRTSVLVDPAVSAFGRRLTPHGWTTTGVPAGVARKIRRSTAFGNRMQPFETARPIDHGSFVPWIAIGPPCAQPVSTGENAEIPTAPGPYGPFGSLGIRRWLT